MSDALRRGIRGGLQLSVAEIFVQFIEAFMMELTEAQHVALLGMLTLLFTIIQNALEDKGSIPALLKAPASEGVNPIPEGDA